MGGNCCPGWRKLLPGLGLHGRKLLPELGLHGRKLLPELGLHGLHMDSHPADHVSEVRVFLLELQHLQLHLLQRVSLLPPWEGCLIFGYRLFSVLGLVLLTTLLDTLLSTRLDTLLDT